MSGVSLPSAPLRVRECATFMGLSPEWIRNAIDEGVLAHGVRVKLEAETLDLSGHKRTFRIHEHQFTAFLQAIGWKHLPRTNGNGHGDVG